MLKQRVKSAFGPLSCAAGEGWGEAAFKARGAEAALIRPSCTPAFAGAGPSFSSKRENGLSSSTFSTSRDAR